MHQHTFSLVHSLVCYSCFALITIKSRCPHPCAMQHCWHIPKKHQKHLFQSPSQGRCREASCFRSYFSIHAALPLVLGKIVFSFFLRSLGAIKKKTNQTKIGICMHGLCLTALLVTNTAHGDEGRESGCKGQTARLRSDTGKALSQMFCEPVGLVCLPCGSSGEPGWGIMKKKRATWTCSYQSFGWVWSTRCSAQGIWNTRHTASDFFFFCAYSWH